MGEHCSDALSLTDRSGVRQAAAVPDCTACTERSARPPLSIETALAAAGTERIARLRSATQEGSLRATVFCSTAAGRSPLRLEQELGLVVVDQEANLLGEDVVAAQR